MPVSLSNHQVPKLRAFIRGSSSCVIDPPDASFSEAQQIADKSTTIIQEFRTNQISKSDAWFLLAKVFLSKSVPLLPLSMMEDFNTVETLLVCFFVPLALPLVLICLFFFFVFVALVFVLLCAIEAFLLVVLLFKFPTTTTTTTSKNYNNNNNSTPTTTDNTVL